MTKIRIVSKVIDGETIYMVQHKVLFNLIWLTDGGDDGTLPAASSGYSPYTFKSVDDAMKYVITEYGKTKVIKTFEL